MGKTMMDFAKVVVVASGVFSAATVEKKLLGWITVGIIFLLGVLIYPGQGGRNV